MFLFVFDVKLARKFSTRVIKLAVKANENRVVTIIPQLAVKDNPMLGSIISSVGDALTGSRNREAQRDANDQNAALQREFAQNGIRWKVADAKAAGLHPLAALGAQTMSPTASFQASADNTMSNIGQNIGRAVDATRTRNERAAALAADAESRSIQLENGRLQNELLRSQIMSINSRASNPAFPGSSTFLDGQGDAVPTAGTKTVPVEVSSHSSHPSKAAGIHPDMTYTRTQNGLALVPSKDAKALIEDQFVPEMMWAARNHLGSFIKDPPYPKEAPLPAGYSHWKWHPMLQEWRPARINQHGKYKRYLPRFLGGNN